MARESLPDKAASEPRPGGSQGLVLAAVEEKDILAEGTASAKALGPSVLVSGSELVRSE